MIRSFLYLITLSLWIQACSTAEDQNSQPAALPTEVPIMKVSSSLAMESKQDSIDPILHNRKYRRLKSEIALHLQAIKSDTSLQDEMRYDSLKHYVSHILIDSIFSYWIGTPWDFNGYTDKPRVGEIACGYFVSTTIRDLGVPINRYKVAQKAAAYIIKDLCDPQSIQRFTSFEKMSSLLEQQADNEIFIVGLDFHVGFLFRRRGKLYFAHSNYINSEGVIIEEAEHSVALGHSRAYVLGNLSSNKILFSPWLP